MDYSRREKTPKGIIRNDDRREGIMKITKAFTNFIRRSSELKHNHAKDACDNFCVWINDTVSGTVDLCIAEDNYSILDKEESMKGLKEGCVKDAN